MRHVTVVHEVGHAIVAHHFGFRVFEIDVAHTADRKSGGHFDFSFRITPLRASQAWLDRGKPAYLMGGMAAEILDSDRATLTPEILHHGHGDLFWLTRMFFRSDPAPLAEENYELHEAQRLWNNSDAFHAFAKKHIQIARKVIAGPRHRAQFARLVAHLEEHDYIDQRDFDHMVGLNKSWPRQLRLANALDERAREIVLRHSRVD